MSDLIYTDGMCQRVVWDVGFPGVNRTPPFANAVRMSRLMAQSGLFNPMIVAAAVQRSWLAERRAARSSVSGAPDEFVDAVREEIRHAAS
jgi:hypothetical protein